MPSRAASPYRHSSSDCKNAEPSHFSAGTRSSPSFVNGNGVEIETKCLLYEAKENKKSIEIETFFLK